MKVKYPIGVKLVVIVTLISIISLGAITALVSWMVSGDVRATADDNNYSINLRSASEAEEKLRGMKSNANVLLNIVDTLSDAEGAATVSAWFFDEHKDIAAVGAWQGGAASSLLVNRRFVSDNEIDPALLSSYPAQEAEAARAAAQGMEVLRNAAPAFGSAIIALFYPRTSQGLGTAAFVLFSSESLSESFGTGANISYLINGEGDVLVHPNAELVKVGANFGNQAFVREMRQNPNSSMQTVYADADGVRWMGAFSKLGVGDAAVITSIEYKKVFEGIAATTRRNIYLTVAVLALAGILIWLFSKTISAPMKSLAAAAEQIEGGNFDVQLKPKTSDEIGALTDSFGKMSGALGIFGKFTNREIAVKAMRGEIKPGGLPKNATVFFSDIRGFTEKSENFTKKYGEEASDKIVHWLNDYFTRMVACVEKTNGVIDKYIGDAVMAHWGTASTAGSPQADAFNCVKAALLMRSALYEMNKNRSADDAGNPPIRIGCGINSGIVTAGQIGSTERMEYTVIGDPVNLASRTEALNKPLGTDILITEDTWKLVGDYLITEEMPSVHVKGKAAPVRMFAVVNIKPKSGEAVKGPATLAEVRQLLGIAAPDLSKVDMDGEEKKYKIGEG
jgi:adenylate cyclase